MSISKAAIDAAIDDLASMVAEGLKLLGQDEAAAIVSRLENLFNNATAAINSADPALSVAVQVAEQAADAQAEEKFDVGPGVAPVVK